MCSKILVAVTSERAYHRVNILMEFYFKVVNFELILELWNFMNFSKILTFQLQNNRQFLLKFSLYYRI